MLAHSNPSIPNGRTVLVVDDSKFYRAMFVDILEEDGYVVVTAGDGAAALEIVRSTKLDCVLLDISLPGISGLDVLVEMKGDPNIQAVPVIMVTGSHNEQIITEAFDAGAADYIAKPVSAPLARARVRMAIQNQHMVGELKGANDQLLAARAEAERANRAKSAFLASMSHEIRTPLTAILGFTDVLIEDQTIRQVAADRLNDLRTIKRNGEHLLELINDILDLSKIEAGKLEIERIPWSLPRLITDVTSSMQGRASVKGIELITEYQGPIPETIHVDPTRLRQVLVNLLGNAIKFTDDGSVRLTIRISAGNPEEALLVFQVIDTGIGMSEEEMRRLFRPFSQASKSTSRHFGGTGLGLTISRHLTELMNGQIWVASQPGQGSTFTFSLPIGSLLETRLLDNPDEARQADGEHGAPAVMIPARILLVEDSPDNQRLVTFHLRRAGAEVSIAENGCRAVELVRESIANGRSFDLILMDLHLPELDGISATRQIRALGYSRTIIALTANAMAGDRERCLEAGCDDYASKPINRQSLLLQIDRHLATMRACAITPITRAGS